MINPQTRDEAFVLSVLADHRLMQRGAIKLDRLAVLANVSRREAEAAVQSARLHGVPIISGSDGVRLTYDSAEVRATAEALRKRARTQLLTARALLRTARTLEDQLESIARPSLWDNAA